MPADADAAARARALAKHEDRARDQTVHENRARALGAYADRARALAALEDRASALAAHEDRARALAALEDRANALATHEDRARALAAHEAEVVACRACPRLVTWREQVAATKRAAYADHDYWGRPVPGFGDPAAWLLIVGLAPGAHGSNRTGRMFTGDRSGEWLFRSLHRAGLASAPVATARDDGLALIGAWLTAAVRCAPPANKPTPGEWAACRPFLSREIALLPDVRVVVALGAFAWRKVLDVGHDAGWTVPRPLPRFGHGAVADLGDVALIGSYHPSQQNTFTGKLTEPMLDAVWAAAQRSRALDGGAGR